MQQIEERLIAIQNQQKSFEAFFESEIGNMTRHIGGLQKDIASMKKLINGNGHLGIAGRLIVMEDNCVARNKQVTEHLKESGTIRDKVRDNSKFVSLASWAIGAIYLAGIGVIVRHLLTSHFGG